MEALCLNVLNVVKRNRKPAFTKKKEPKQDT
jgi:hypothetical protein